MGCEPGWVTYVELVCDIVVLLNFCLSYEGWQGWLKLDLIVIVIKVGQPSICCWCSVHVQMLQWAFGCDFWQVFWIFRLAGLALPPDPGLIMNFSELAFVPLVALSGFEDFSIYPLLNAHGWRKRRRVTWLSNTFWKIFDSRLPILAEVYVSKLYHTFTRVR